MKKMPSWAIGAFLIAVTTMSTLAPTAAASAVAPAQNAPATTTGDYEAARLRRVQSLRDLMIPGEVPTYYTSGYERHARSLQTLLTGEREFYKKELGVDVPFSLAVLDAKQWGDVEKETPFGMPNVDGKPVVAMIPANWAEVPWLITKESAADPALVKATRKHVTDWMDAQSQTFDTIGGHELGHALENAYGIVPGTRWLNEFLASYFLYAYVDSRRRDLLWTVPVLQATNHLDRPQHHVSLDDFESLYEHLMDQDPGNYGWYQGKFIEQAQKIYAQQGIGFLKKVRAAFPPGRERFTLGNAETLSRLDRINPGFSSWAHSLESLPQTPPPKAPIKPVMETLYGVKVTDNYRYMEKLDLATLAWMKAEGAYTRKVLDAIAPLTALQRRVSAFTGSFGFVQGYVSYGGRAFYEERAPGADDFNLKARDAVGTRTLFDVDALRMAHGGKPYAINWFLASPDGSKVAVGVSEGGSENASMTVYNAATGKAVAGPLDRVRFGATAWSNDSTTVYFNRLRQMKPGDRGTDTYNNSTLYGWNLQGKPVAILGTSVAHGPKFTPEEFPGLTISPGSTEALAVSINGVQNEWKAWAAPASDVAKSNTVWKPFVDRSDEVTGMDARGNEIFLLSHKDAPTFKILEMKAGQPLSTATTLVAAQPDRVIEKIAAASDALYVLVHKGAYSQLLRIPAGSDKAEDVVLPFEGHVGEAFTDPRQAGIVFELSSWVVQPTLFRYDPSTQKFAALNIGHRGDMDANAFKISDLQAKAADGVMVPLSLIQPKDAKGPQITLVSAYGSYGISDLADFNPRLAAAMREGITYGICHVRGGGEKGEAWRLGGKDANKHHTWEDLIACGEDLIARGITTKDKLFIVGASAGGITVGRAMTERPDLFAGVLDFVPVANPLRQEFSPNGPPNIPEFGSVKDEQGFKNLYAMDSLQHVKHGVTYPAVMINTGLNDPRVSPWEPAKFAAALQASGTPDPVLLRIDANAGHSIGSTRTQMDQLTGDWIAFVFWRAGKNGWRPDKMD